MSLSIGPTATRAETIDSRDERRWDRGAWLTLAAAVLILVFPWFITLAALPYPTDGWSIRTESLTIAGGAWRMGANLTGGPSNLQSGDNVLAVNGRPLTPDTLPPFPDDLRAGQVLRYTVQRVDETLDVDVPLVTLTPVALLRDLVSDPQTLAVYGGLLLLASLAFFLRPGMAGPRYMLLAFSFFAGATGVGAYNLFHYTYPPLLTFLIEFYNTGWAWVLAPSLTLLALAYPLRKRPLRRFPRLLPAALYGGFALLEAVFVLLIVITRDPSPGASLIEATAGVSMALFVVTTLTCLVHNFLTVRDPVARAQLRWIALGFGAGLAMPLVIFEIAVLYGASPIGDEPASELFSLIFLILPLSLAIGMLRYRLFDIDVIIRRTTSYAIITGLLALVYFGSIVILQRLLTPFTGESDVAVVLSTLLIAALFLPIRRRVQDVIDRRFNRTRYDAEKTIEAFAATVRNETDLDALTAELLRVIQQTMEPESLSILLFDPAADGSKIMYETLDSRKL